MPFDPKRLRLLFEEWADLPQVEVERRMAEDLGTEPTLRAELGRLLARDRLDTGGPLARTLQAEPPENQTKDPVRLGRFHVLRQLGAGGMGVVYDAYDEVLDRKVALKLLHGSVALHGQLLQEARALARLSHPNVVPIYEVGEHEGRPFLAMERIEGQPLSAWLKGPGLSISDKLRVLMQAGRGLSAAHERGVIHRDFKPDNVLVGQDGRARVLDFGIAALGPFAEGGVVAGTPAFMAPEQLLGDGVTPLTDQFAFGVVLYHIAYGAAPFGTGDLSTLRENVLSGALRPPPRHSDAPVWIAPIVTRALSTDPALRFPSMDALLKTIEQHVPADPKDDPAPTQRERRVLLTVSFVCTLGLSLTALIRGPDKLLGTPPRAFAASLFLFFATSLPALMLWPKLRQTDHGKRSVFFFGLCTGSLVAHRALGWRLGTPLPHILAEDYLVLSALLGGGALLFDRRLWIPALLFCIATLVSGYNPGLAQPLFPFFGPALVALVLSFTLRR